MFGFDRALIMSVNLSGKQFAQPDLVDRIQVILDTTGLSAKSLKLEITESVVMDDVESAIAVLKQMKALNVKLGIDDFGTGYSSLSYLSRFPTDTLKVDKSFVGRMEIESEGENVAIVRTIVALAHALGMDVIAEGVETAAQLARLRAIGCEYGQGYFFAKPLPSEAATALMASEPEW
jgi:EAL domain-containing protein (putative c-di-GMP-specific phosphodiesterase class I)